MVSSAIYRYVPSRDELLTMLITEGYRGSADAVDAALEQRAVRESDENLGRTQGSTISHAMREWAIARPAAWSLLYGSPVPGYTAPAQETTPQGTRVVLRLGRVLIEAIARGDISPVVGPLNPDHDSSSGSAASGSRGACARSGRGFRSGGSCPGRDRVDLSLLGAISSEVFGHGQVPFGYPDAFAKVQLAAIADAVGLRA